MLLMPTRLDLETLHALFVRWVIYTSEADPFCTDLYTRKDDFFHLIHLLEKVQELTIIRCQCEVFLVSE